MHQAGIAHGQLHGGSVVVDGNYEPFIVNLGYAFDIIDHSWNVELFMRNDFCWSGSYTEFVNHDYHNWRMILDGDADAVHEGEPQDMVPHTEEYYINRFYMRENDELYLSDLLFVITLRTIIGADIISICYETEKVTYSYYANMLPTGKYVDITGIYPNRAMLLKANKKLFEHQHDSAFHNADPIVREISKDTVILNSGNAEYVHHRANEVANFIKDYFQSC